MEVFHEPDCTYINREKRPIHSLPPLRYDSLQWQFMTSMGWFLLEKRFGYCRGRSLLRRLAGTYRYSFSLPSNYAKNHYLNIAKVVTSLPQANNQTFLTKIFRLNQVLVTSNLALYQKFFKVIMVLSFFFSFLISFFGIFSGFANVLTI